MISIIRYIMMTLSGPLTMASSSNEESKMWGEQHWRETTLWLLCIQGTITHCSISPFYRGLTDGTCIKNL